MNVLNVMWADAADAAQYRDKFISGERAKSGLAESDAARADVAELIEADREYDAVKAEHDACAKYDEHGAYVPREMYERMEAVSARRAAALARVGGAP